MVFSTPLSYLALRTIRHFLPDEVARYLLRRGLVIRPGQETADPDAAVKRYVEVLDSLGVTLAGKRILVFGYGGSFAVGCGLIEAGAQQVTLCDKYAPPDDRRNAVIQPRYSAYLVRDGRRVRPRPEFLVLLEADIRGVSIRQVESPFDVVLSSCVFEHLEDVEGVTRALAQLTSSHGVNIHLVDLRDHYFKYPFEMLCYSEVAWRKWLNPGSNLNRFRMVDYRQVFERYFQKVRLEVIAQDELAFQHALPRIHPEFLTGDPDIDSATLIQVVAHIPLTEPSAHHTEVL